MDREAHSLLSSPLLFPSVLWTNSTWYISELYINFRNVIRYNNTSWGCSASLEDYPFQDAVCSLPSQMKMPYEIQKDFFTEMGEYLSWMSLSLFQRKTNLPVTQDLKLVACASLGCANSFILGFVQLGTVCLKQNWHIQFEDLLCKEEHRWGQTCKNMSHNWS